MSNESAPLVLPTVKDSKVVLDEFIQVRCDVLTLPNYQHDYYTIVTKSSAVMILAITDDGQFVLNQEYRHPVKSVVLCCPGGYLDKGEDPIEGGKRELLEETGFSAEKFILMGSSYPYAGLSDQRLFYVLAEGAKKIRSVQHDPGEVLKTVIMSIEQLEKEIKKNGAIDGTMCTAIFYYNLMQK